MKVLEAAYRILAEAGEPLHYKEVCRRMLEQNLWRTEAKTPEATLNARLAVDIKHKGPASRFMRTAPGTFALNPHYSSGLPPTLEAQKADKETAKRSSMTFTDAAEYVLEHLADRKPMHYRQITDKALELGLLETSGQTPEATMYSQILAEVQRHTRRGEAPRFTKPERGYVGLTRWLGTGLIRQIEQQNRQVRKRLRQRLMEMSPADFEELVGQLLASLGFEEVIVTSISGDGGIDVRGTLVVGEVIRTRMAVQVKRWKNNVQAPVVQQVRGSLGAHEQGLIITTSDFSKGARKEAERADATPVALMNGEQLVTLLIEHNLGVRRESYDLIELVEEETE